MRDDQRHARIFGVLFVITFITSIAALGLFQPVLDDPVGYVTGGGKDNQIYLAALLEFFLIVSGIGTAVVLYPIARRQDEVLALGYVASRIMESVFIAMGIIFVLGLVSLRQDSPGAADLAPAAVEGDGEELARSHCPVRLFLDQQQMLREKRRSDGNPCDRPASAGGRL